MENDSLFPDYDGSLPNENRYKGLGPLISKLRVAISEYEGYTIQQSLDNGLCTVLKDGQEQHKSTTLEKAWRWIDVITGKVR